MLTNKVVVITGGAGRIGKSFASMVARNNGIAIIADVDESYGSQVIAEIQQNLLKNQEQNIVFYKINIGSKVSVSDLIANLHNRYKRIDALINNAYPRNKNYGKKLFDIDHNDFSDFLTLHLGGYFNISQQFIKYYLEQGFGNIVNISSIQGVAAPAFETYEGTDMHSPIEYTVAKHGLLGMTKYFAKMFKKDNIRVNAISPGGILDKQPERFLQQYKNRCGNKGMLDSQDLNGTLLYLLSDMSKFLTGQNLIVDDGFSL